MTNKKIIIDTDPGHDDMLAMLLVLAAPDIDVLAVTTVAGNSTIENVTNNARFILDLAGDTDIPLYSGAANPLAREQVLAVVHGESGLDGANVQKQVPLNDLAVEKIIELVRENPNEISLLILGPQTNVAQAIQKDPQTMKLIREFVIMGGAFDVPGNKNRVAEFNVCVDPEAAAIVAKFEVPKVYIPLDVCNKIQIPLEDFKQVNDKTIRKELLSALRPFIENIRIDEMETEGALVYDALAAYYLMKPEVCQAKDDAVVVETKGEYTFGMTLVDKRPISKKEPANATIVTDIPREQFIEDFFTVLNGDGALL